ncbi:MAG: DUF3426 domain-containing protein [Thioalkalivibrio sp.]|nr:DUF3426 domain-containing protein [Thioalkalivibrio sp.]
MIIRCPHCGTGHAVRYHLGHKPATQHCPACGQTFPFFPALEIELVGQPCHTTVAARVPVDQTRVALPTESGDSPILPPRGTPDRSPVMTLSAYIPRDHDWPLRLAGFLAGLVLMGWLRVEMHLTNHLPRPQPWPLLEMVLSDRFGQTLSLGRWHPSEYLGLPTLTPGAIRMLEPGEIRRLRLVIDTPEGEVEGIAVWMR